MRNKTSPRLNSATTDVWLSGSVVRDLVLVDKMGDFTEL